MRVGEIVQVNGRFGTFGGVFTPCVLTILGVIMFLRFGYVVGAAGIWQAVAIVLLAKVITTLTTLSLAAISTNTRVRAGGAYFLISRSLGVESGGAIGVIFYLAQAVSVAMYVVGFTEALLWTFPDVGFAFVPAASLVNCVVFLCVYIGAGWTVRMQYGILAILVASLVSFFAGAAASFDFGRLRDNLGSGYESGTGFFTAFALFFPAATGIMAGANMSGDLKEPGRAIPRGTLLAVAATGAIYLLMALFLGGAASRDALMGDGFVVRDLAVAGAAVTAGVFAATLSSALGSMMGAPRILQALAGDRIFNRLRFFAQGSGPANEPRRATVLTFLIAQGAVMIGDLDAIAPVITMFFMITYGFLNLATFYEAATRNPSYRPRFRFCHWSTALAGAVACAAVMVLVSPLWALVAIAATFLLQRFIGRRNIIATWGDLGLGVAFAKAQRALLRLDREPYHPKNWRPSLLALSGLPWQRVHIAVWGSWLSGRGYLTLGQVIAGESEQHLRRRTNQEAALQSFIRKEDLRAFPAVIVSPTLELGIDALVQCHGVGAFRPNVVLLGWSADAERQGPFLDILRNVAELERSIVVVRVADEDLDGDPWIAPVGTIDVWWRGKGNGPLMLLLAHLLASNQTWRGKRIRLLRVIGEQAGDTAREEARAHLAGLIHEARIEARAVVVRSDEPIAAIHEHSHEAAATFVGLQPPAEGEDAAFVRRTETMLETLGTVIFVWSTGEMQLEA